MKFDILRGGTSFELVEADRIIGVVADERVLGSLRFSVGEVIEEDASTNYATTLDPGYMREDSVRINS